ncbi:1,3,6,8-tetrahydroxynaphthalene synthase [Streptomyces sp. enrichment culture]
MRTRHLVQPVEETLEHPGSEERDKLHEAEARVPEVIQRALDDAELLTTDTA